MKNRKRPHPNDTLWDAYVDHGKNGESLVGFSKRIVYMTDPQPGETLENHLQRINCVERSAVQYIMALEIETLNDE